MVHLNKMQMNIWKIEMKMRRKQNFCQSDENFCEPHCSNVSRTRWIWKIDMKISKILPKWWKFFSTSLLQRMLAPHSLVQKSSWLIVVVSEFWQNAVNQTPSNKSNYVVDKNQKIAIGEWDNIKEIKYWYDKLIWDKTKRITKNFLLFSFLFGITI